MKKVSEIFSIIGCVLGLIGVVVCTGYLVIHIGYLGTDILAMMDGQDYAKYLAFEIVTVVIFLLLGAYFVFVTFTGYLTYKVITQNILDKIKKFGILSIIFFNPIGGIFVIQYDKELKKYLEDTAPKGKRKEVKKVEKE